MTNLPSTKQMYRRRPNLARRKTLVKRLAKYLGMDAGVLRRWFMGIAQPIITAEEIEERLPSYSVRKNTKPQPYAVRWAKKHNVRLR